MNSTILYSAVRAELGKVSNTVDIEDIDILRESEYILTEIADRITVKVRRSITSVADQEEYAVHVNTVRVINVFPYSTSDQDIFGTDVNRLVGQADSAEFFNFPSTWAIEKQRQIRALPRIKWEFNPVERKLKISPYPTQTGDLYWYISIEHISWTLAALPSDFEHLLITGTVWKCLEIVALARSTQGGIMRSGGMIDYPALILRSFVQDKKEEFYSGLNFKSVVYRV